MPARDSIRDSAGGAARAGRRDSAGGANRDRKPARRKPRTSVRAAILERPLTSYQLILVTTALLSVIGLVMVFSASSVDSYTETHSVFSVVKKQVMWLAIGIPAFWLGLRLRPQAYRRVAYPALVITIIALLAVLVPGIGDSALGARRWIDFGPLQLQPSEPAKLALALWGADLLVRKHDQLDRWRHLLFPIVPIGALLGALVMLEPDLGTTLCLALVLFGLLWTVGAPFRAFGALALAAIAAVVGLIAMEPYRMARVTSFLDPFADPTDSGYQAVRGLYALGSGGWFGVGLGQSRFKWGLLPEAHTDFIFAILGEELGLVGSLAVLALFAALAYAGLRVARRTSDPFVRLVSAAATIGLTGQALINIGTVTGMLPVTGIPLPLISFGGTSLIMTLFTLGMLASFARHEPDAAASLRVKGLGRTARLLWLPMPDLSYLRPARRRSRFVWDERVGRRVAVDDGRAVAGKPKRKPDRTDRRRAARRSAERAAAIKEAEKAAKRQAKRRAKPERAGARRGPAAASRSGQPKRAGSSAAKAPPPSRRTAEAKPARDRRDTGRSQAGTGQTGRTQAGRTQAGRGQTGRTQRAKPRSSGRSLGATGTDSRRSR